MSLLNQSKVQLSLSLLLIYLLNLFTNFSTNALMSAFLAISAAILSDFIFLKLRKVKLFFPSAAITTGLIIGLLTDPNLPFYLPVLASVFAMFSKNFIRMGRHIFNPASFGLLLTSVFLGASISWWGVAWQILDFSKFQTLIPFLILLSPAFVSIFRMSRFRIILSFLFIYLLGQSIFFKSLNIQTILDPTLVFFSIVMLPEPMTTPNNHLRQILFGGAVGFLVVLLSIFLLPIINLSIDPLIISLLLGNLLFFKLR